MKVFIRYFKIDEVNITKIEKNRGIENALFLWEEDALSQLETPKPKRVGKLTKNEIPFSNLSFLPTFHFIISTISITPSLKFKKKKKKKKLWFTEKTVLPSTYNIIQLLYCCLNILLFSCASHDFWLVFFFLQFILFSKRSGPSIIFDANFPIFCDYLKIKKSKKIYLVKKINYKLIYQKRKREVEDHFTHVKQS